MGIKPRELDQMSAWEFAACLRGWNAAHGGDDTQPAMTADRAKQLGIEGF